MRTWVILLLFGSSCLGQIFPFPGKRSHSSSIYTVTSNVVFPAASGSTQSNITVPFTISDANLKTVGNGGYIYNTVTRTGVTVPADFIITADSTCSSQTGSYTWGWEQYSGSAGTGIVWVKIPSLSSGGSTTVYLCWGASSVTTYQGGSVGAEFDANTVAAWHLPDGSTINPNDWSSSGNNGTTVNSPTAAAGKIGGAVSFSAANSKIENTAGANLPNGGAPAPFTLQGWQKSASYVSLSQLWGFGPQLPTGSTAANCRYVLEFNSNYYFWGCLADWDTGVAFDADNAWHHWAFTWDGSNMYFYRDGTQQATRSGHPGITTAGTYITAGSHHTSGANPDSIQDELKIITVARSADWIATEYASQNSVPAAAASSFI